MSDTKFESTDMIAFHRALRCEEDEKLADALIQRLNELIRDPAICADVDLLLNTRVECSDVTANHPDIQVFFVKDQHKTNGFVGLLGILNGLCGTFDGIRGYISANISASGVLTGFSRTKDLIKAT